MTPYFSRHPFINGFDDILFATKMNIINPLDLKCSNYWVFCKKLYLF